MNKQYFFMSGLPRTGSTLLSAILSQNPKIHAPGNSPVCQLMWDTQISCLHNASEQIKANNREHVIKQIIKPIPDIYHSNSDKPIVLDKCRSWTLPDNLELIREYITKTPKIIILIRPIDEIVCSFVNLYEKNGIKDYSYDRMLTAWSEPIMRSFEGVVFAKMLTDNWFHFVTYSDIVNKPKETLSGIYNFLELPEYEHNFNNIEQIHKENDEVYGVKGQHEIRNKIGRLKYDIKLPKEVKERCDELTNKIF